MPTYYDIHCHLFNKEILKPRLIDMLVPLLPLVDHRDLESQKKVIKILKRLRRTLRIINKPVTGVFAHLDNAYGNDVVVTPLMFDLTYADDNESTRGQNLEYRIRQQMAEQLIEYVTNKLQAMSQNSVEMQEALTWDDGTPLFDEVKERSRDVFDPNNYQEQIDSLEALAKDPANGGRVRPFFGVDPRRWRGREADLIAEVTQRCTGAGALWAGVKLYAPAGFSPTDKLLYGPEASKNGGLYAFCEANAIPITVHCSRSGFACLSQEIIVDGHVNRKVGDLEEIVYYNHRNYRFVSKFFGLNPGPAGAIRERARTLNHPKLWKLVLERFPNLKLNLAHWGNNIEIMAYIHRVLPEEFIKIKPVAFYDLLSLFNDVDKAKIKTHYTLKGGLWQLNEANWPYEDDFKADLDKRTELWDLLAEKGQIDNWTKAIRDILEDPRFVNVRTDLSCFTEMDEDDPNDSIAKALTEFKTMLYDKLTPEVKKKVMYGSDFWLNVMQGPDMKQYFADFKTAFGAEFDDIASVHPQAFL